MTSPLSAPAPASGLAIAIAAERERSSWNAGIGRRDLLRRLGVGAVAWSMLERSGVARASATELPDFRSVRKFDAHAHLGFGPSRRLPVAQLLRTADAMGIERLAVSVPSGPQPAHVVAANDVVLEAMKAHPNRIIGQCCVNPLYAAAALEEVKRCLGEGMCGLGELYTYAKASDPAFFPIVEYCITQNAPMMWHCRADLAMVRSGFASNEPVTTTTARDLVVLAQRYPEAILVHGHIGGGGDWEYMCKTLRETPSIYLDTSGSVSEAGMIDFAVQSLGVDRLLFASDMNFETGVGKILSAKLSQADREKILWRNFDVLLKKRGLHAR